MDSRRFRAVAYRNKVMTVYVLGLMMSVIDGTMVNVALPTLAHEFGVPTTDIEWIAIGYLLSFAAVIPAAGWLGDRFGTKRVFIVSLAIFVAMSLLCGVAQSLDQLVFFRILQGAGGGLVTPVGSAMLYRAFPMAERATAAIGVLSVTVIAPAIGPMLGGIARRRGVVAVDLPDQRARRHRHGGAVDRLAAGGPSRGSRPARRRRARAVGIRCVDPALHAVDRAGAGLVARRPRWRSRSSARPASPP